MKGQLGKGFKGGMFAALAYIIAVAVVSEAVENVARKVLKSDFKDSKIFQGEVTTRKYPFFVAIMAKNKTDPKAKYFNNCGGSLVTPNKVLTAAHCIKGMNFSAYTYEAWFLAINTTKRPAQFMEITSPGVYHSDFNNSGKLEHDIGIYNLPKNAPIGKGGVSTICIRNSNNNNNLAVDLVGFGRYGCTERTEVLRSANGITSDYKTCNQIRTRPIGNDALCAVLQTNDEGYAQINHGDSGSPLFIEHSSGKFEQVGIVSNHITISRTDPCPDRRYPGVYAIPGAHIQFLKENAPRFKTCSSTNM